MALEIHGPIDVVGDSEFAALVSDEGWPGSGTPSDPYLIEGLAILATTPYAVSITDTTVSFVVSGCRLEGTGGSVFLENVRNGCIEWSELCGALRGGLLVDSGEIVISNNSCSASASSFILANSDNLLLENNTLSSGHSGIEIQSCVNLTLRSNAMTGCGMAVFSMSPEHANSHTIGADNTVNGDPVHYLKFQNGGTVPNDAGQVILANCSNMIVQDMVFQGVTVGVSLLFSSDTTVSGVSSTSNSWCGISIQSCTGTSVENCELIDNLNNGIFAMSCENTAVTGCTISSNHMGAVFSHSKDSEFTENSFSLNQYGLYLWSSPGCVLSSNTFVHDDITIGGGWVGDWNTHTIDTTNTVNGKPVVYVKDQIGGEVPDDSGQLILAHCIGIDLADRTFDSGQETAVLMGFCIDISFSDCKFEDNSEGVYMESSYECSFSGNVFLRNGEGIRTQYGTGNTFSGNLFADGYCGICLDGDASFNDISSNVFYGNLMPAVVISRGSTENTVHGNTFVENNLASDVYDPSHAQCYDDCEGNHWDIDGCGNYWSDWVSPDDDGDGIVDDQYGLVPAGLAYDRYPLTAPPSEASGAGLEYISVSVTLLRTAYQAGEDVEFTVEVTNDASETAEVLFPSNQWIDFSVEDSEGRAIYDYSPFVLWGFTVLTLGPGETYVEDLVWMLGDEPVPDGNYTVVANLAGFEETNLRASAVVTLDGVEPVTEAVLDGEEGEAGWYISSVSVSIESTDDLSGVDVVEYRIGDAEWSTYVGEFELSEDGAHMLECRSTDLAGNVGDAGSEEVRIDCTAPVVSIMTDDGAVFGTSSANISLSCSDACSGMDRVEYSLDDGAYVEFEAEEGLTLDGLSDGTYVLSVRGYDCAGNVASDEISFEVSITSDDDGKGNAEDESHWPIVGVTLAAVAAVLLIAAYMLKRRPPAPKE